MRREIDITLINYYSAKQKEYLDKAYSYLKNKNLENFYINKRESCKYELLGYKVSGLVTGVEILSANDSKCCAECRKLHGKIINLEDALNVMPIPVKDCKNECGFCRCCYLPTVE